MNLSLGPGVTLIVSDDIANSLRGQLGNTVPPVTQPPVTQPPAGTPALPAVLAGRAVMQSVLAWQAWDATSRRISPAQLDDGNVWLCRFVTGDASAHDIRLAGAEYGGGPIPRHAMLIRERDGKVLTTVAGTTPTIWATFVTTQAVSPLVVPKPVVEPHAAYTLAVWNDPGHGAGKMLMDLYI